ncbi:MAG: hypothetical protein L0Z50_30520, partial [Verrucomicrobiales bacterium]|nr:hypothetical protein [Verrucomicrobiales bacterium]
MQLLAETAADDMKRQNSKQVGVSVVDFGLMSSGPLSPLQVGPQGLPRTFQEAMAQANSLATGLNQQVFGGQGI